MPPKSALLKNVHQILRSSDLPPLNRRRRGSVVTLLKKRMYERDHRGDAALEMPAIFEKTPILLCCDSVSSLTLPPVLPPQYPSQVIANGGRYYAYVDQGRVDDHLRDGLGLAIAVLGKAGIAGEPGCPLRPAGPHIQPDAAAGASLVINHRARRARVFRAAVRRLA
jgi:hypothetical protein